MSELEGVLGIVSFLPPPPAVRGVSRPSSFCELVEESSGPWFPLTPVPFSQNHVASLKSGFELLSCLSSTLCTV